MQNRANYSAKRLREPEEDDSFLNKASPPERTQGQEEAEAGGTGRIETVRLGSEEG